MPVDPDETPPEGLQAQDEVPTSPDLAVGLRCPECHGERMTLSLIQRNEDGAVERAVASPCVLCKAAGTVDRKTWRLWHARRKGRPE